MIAPDESDDAKYESYGRQLVGADLRAPSIETPLNAVEHSHRGHTREGEGYSPRRKKS